MNFKIDYTYIKEAVDDNQDALNEILELFICETPIAINNIEEALNKEDWDHIRKGVHKLKSSLSMLGLNEITEKCSSCENIILENKDFKLVPELTMQIISDCKELVKQIKSDYKKAK